MSNRVLLVDDEQNIVDFTRSRFEREGLTVRTAANGSDALGQLLPAASSDIDLVVLDIGLPDIDGFEVLRRLRNGGSDVPVVILSARTDDVDRIVGLELGADDYVMKPFNPRELAARVRGLLRRMQQVRALREQVGVSKALPGGLALDPARRSASYQGRASTCGPRSSTCSPSSPPTPARCSAAPRCWNGSGATTATLTSAPWTFISAACARS